MNKDLLQDNQQPGNFRSYTNSINLPNSEQLRRCILIYVALKKTTFQTSSDQPMKQLNFNLYNLNSYRFLFYKVITLNTQIYSRQITFIVIILWPNCMSPTCFLYTIQLYAPVHCFRKRCKYLHLRFQVTVKCWTLDLPLSLFLLDPMHQSSLWNPRALWGIEPSLFTPVYFFMLPSLKSTCFSRITG